MEDRRNWTLKLVSLATLGLLAWSVTSCGSRGGASITQEELVRRTQEMFDAVAGGNQEPWKKYLAEDVLYFTEKGQSMDKAHEIADVQPLPKGYSGSIKITTAQSRILGDTAILSYDLDETETVFGQELHARYHETDTWMRRNGQWQIVAGQVLRYYEDPAVGSEDSKKHKEYEGVYELAPDVKREVTGEGKDLYVQRAGREKQVLLPEATDIYFRKGVEGRILFRHGADGKVDALIDRRNNEDVTWKKTK